MPRSDLARHGAWFVPLNPARQASVLQRRRNHPRRYRRTRVVRLRYHWIVLAVYAVSFWHYLLYWRAYRHGSDAPARFRRRAVALKTLALAAFAYAWLGTPWHWPSAVVMAAGFLLNFMGARALGPARTYYGWELGEVAARRVTTFPYSLTAHPMLLGNLVAFGAPLLNPAFRAAWWPLAGLHLLGNVALLVMETHVRPLPGRNRRRPIRPLEAA